MPSKLKFVRGHVGQYKGPRHLQGAQSKDSKFTRIPAR